MIIDFHTHVFPESIAARTIDSLKKRSHATAALDGTLDSLRASMKRDHIDYSIILPVITKPSQFESINQYAADINNTDGILSFGGIHPDNDNIPEKLSYIKSLGLKGIKLHPDYQNTYIDDERYIGIIKECLHLDLCTVIHAGLDIGLPAPIHCPPDRAFIMLQKVLSNYNGDSKIILAHVGGHLQWRLVEEFLVGQNIYFDLSYSMHLMEQDTLVRIIQNHGSDRILFATDSPWSSQKKSVELVQSLPLCDDDLDNIFYKNAMRLLNM